MKLRSYAKINLTLDIIGKRSDGYHELKTVFQHVNLYDELEFKELKEDKIQVKCNVKELESEKNIAYKAASLLKNKYSISKGVKIIITKNIPMGAGLSGGSSNAAAVLKGLNVFWDLNLTKEEMLNLSKEIGMDVAFHIIGGTCLGRGRGEQLEKLIDLKKYFIIIVYPGFEVSTKDAFSNLDYDLVGKVQATEKFVKDYNLKHMHNDFEYSVLNKFSVLKEIKKELGETAKLSGSGSCVFALYEDKAAAEGIYKKIVKKYPSSFLTTTYNRHIELAREIGFCFGVKRAIEQINKIGKEKKVHILGNLIHNPQVISDLKQKGVEMVDDISQAKEGIVVISAHGTADKNKEEVKSRGLELIDLTCPFVTKVHDITKDAQKRGRKIFVYGDKEHTEVKGIIGNLTNYQVIKELPKSGLDCKITLVSQTTRDVEEFEKLAKQLKDSGNSIEVKDTICFATKDRQKSAIELAKKSEIMIIIGGKISSNTIRLKEVCSAYCETKHIEIEKELNTEWFFGKEKIGISAGASTPRDIIEKVKERIELIG